MPKKGKKVKSLDGVINKANRTSHAASQNLTQLDISKKINNYINKLKTLNDASLIFVSNLFGIAIDKTREERLDYFRNIIAQKLIKSKCFNLMDNFIAVLNKEYDFPLFLKKPQIPRVLQYLNDVGSFYFLVQFNKEIFFDLPNFTKGTLCVGQFISDNPYILPYGDVTVNGEKLSSVNFGELSNTYYLLNFNEKHNLIKLDSPLKNSAFIWFIIRFFTVNKRFISNINASGNTQAMIKSTKCKNNCPPFDFKDALENACRTGFLTCPNCHQKFGYEHAQMVDRNDYINFWLNDNSFVDKIESNSRDISKQPSLPHEWGFFCIAKQCY